MTKLDLNRRNLLKGASLAAMCALPMGEGIAKEYSDKIRWDETTDVLVVGFGGAGAVTAVTAHDLARGPYHRKDAGRRWQHGCKCRWLHDVYRRNRQGLYLPQG